MADEHISIDGGTPLNEEQSLGGQVGALVLAAQNQLQDETGTAWPPSKILPYVNLALLEIVTLKPEAYPVESVLQLVAGARQSVSATTTISILDFICNMGTGGATPGRAILSVVKRNMDKLLPDYHSYASGQEVYYAAKDDRNPLVFYVFPPQPTSGMNQIKVLLSQPPADITNDNTDFPLDASYKPAFVDYLIYRCLMEETQIQGANQKAVAFYNKFLQQLGLKASVDKQNEVKN